MLKVESLQLDALEQGVFTTTEQLRLFTLPLLTINIGIVSRLVRNNDGLSALGLKIPGSDNKLAPTLTEIDDENRVMLNDLYRHFGADSEGGITKESRSCYDYERRQIIIAPNGVTFVESTSIVGDQSAFDVKAWSANGVAWLDPSLCSITSSEYLD